MDRSDRLNLRSGETSKELEFGHTGQDRWHAATIENVVCRRSNSRPAPTVKSFSDPSSPWVRIPMGQWRQRVQMSLSRQCVYDVTGKVPRRLPRPFGS